MRNLFVLVALSFLAQSCFSYRETDNNPKVLVVGKKYKITHHSESSKVVVKQITDSILIVSRGKKEQHIQLQDITEIQKRKFSIVKTTVLALLLVPIISFMVNPKINVGAGSSSTN